MKPVRCYEHCYHRYYLLEKYLCSKIGIFKNLCKFAIFVPDTDNICLFKDEPFSPTFTTSFYQGLCTHHRSLQQDSRIESLPICMSHTSGTYSTSKNKDANRVLQKPAARRARIVRDTSSNNNTNRDLRQTTARRARIVRDTSNNNNANRVLQQTTVRRARIVRDTNVCYVANSLFHWAKR